MVEEHKTAPHLRVLQRKLTEEITILVHGKAELEKAIKASNILFGNSTSDDLKELDGATFLEIFYPSAEFYSIACNAIFSVKKSVAPHLFISNQRGVIA